MARWWKRDNETVRQPASVEEALEQCSSSDGHAREIAVIALRNLRDPRAVGALLERANDWVPQVRHQAKVGLQQLLVDEFLQAWIVALPQVVRLSQAHRADHSALLQDIALYLGAPARLRALAAAEHSADRASRRWVVALRLNHPADPLEHYQLVRQALMSNDAVTACKALAVVAATEDANKKARLFGIAAAYGQFSNVRARGLREAVAAPDSTTPSLIRALCFDANRSIRALALASAGGEIVQVERQASDILARGERPGRDQAIALEVLCTLRSQAACALLCEKAARSDHPRLKLAAFSWMLRAADEEAKAPLVLQLLRDPAPKIRRLAREAVRRGAAAPDAEALLELARSVHAALRDVLAVAEHLSPWERFGLLLRLWPSRRSGEHSAAELATAMNRWCRDVQYNFMQPYPEQRRKIGGLWKDTRHNVAQPLRQQIAHQLAHFGVLTLVP